MSFTKDAKLQVLNKVLENDCCNIAFLSGIFRASGQLTITDGKPNFFVITDIEQLYSVINNYVKKLYGDYAEIEMTDDHKINKTLYYKITFSESILFNLLKDTGLIIFDEKNNLIQRQDIDENILKEDCCKRAFIKGVFIGSATSSIKLADTSRQSGGYHFEFASHDYELLSFTSLLLAEYEILGKLIKRRNLYVVYIKESEQICDLLALVEAVDSVIELNNEIAQRDLRNKVNRQTNCLNGNIGKMVNASLRQTKAITLINDLVGLEALPLDLQVIALLRLANPEESLDELIRIGGLTLTKSGLNHRLKKLEKIAEELGK